jgi:hypothetical protein
MNENSKNPIKLSKDNIDCRIYLRFKSQKQVADYFHRLLLRTSDSVLRYAILHP